jgi:hypothetical protein
MNFDHIAGQRVTDLAINDHRRRIAAAQQRIAAGGFLAWLVYRHLGIKFVSRSWFNLDATWAFSLILMGALSFTITVASRP